MPFRNPLQNPRIRRVLVDLAAVVLAIVVGGVAFSIAARGQLTLGPAQVAVSLSPAIAPRTVVELPPFGTIEAPTHVGPVRVVVHLKELDIMATQRMIESGALSLPDMIEVGSAASLPVSGLGMLLARLILAGLAAAAFGGALVVLALRRRRLVVAIAVALAVGVPAASVGLAYASWDVASFREPTLRGNLTYAPQIVDVFSTRVANIQRLRGEVSKVASELAGYYADERSLAAGGAFPESYRVLHITDLHLDPVGAQLARSLVRSYDASLVIDTGDLPIFGADIESATFASLLETSVPRVYIPGNHDSPVSIAALRGLGVRVLTTGTAEVDGLRIFGVPDPVSRGFGVEPDHKLIDAATDAAFSQFEESLRSEEATPDIVALHNPRMERPFFGKVPLILSGHTHSARFYVSKGTARLNSGTLGGIGYEPASARRKPLPYSASVLYYTAELPRRLIAIDRISVHSNASTTITREVIDEALLP